MARLARLSRLAGSTPSSRHRTPARRGLGGALRTFALPVLTVTALAATFAVPAAASATAAAKSPAEAAASVSASTGSAHHPSRARRQALHGLEQLEP